MLRVEQRVHAPAHCCTNDLHGRETYGRNEAGCRTEGKTRQYTTVPARPSAALRLWTRRTMGNPLAARPGRGHPGLAAPGNQPCRSAIHPVASPPPSELRIVHEKQ